MKKNTIFITLTLVLACLSTPLSAQPGPAGASRPPAGSNSELMGDLPHHGDSILSAIVVNVNTMDASKQEKLNDVASQYRTTRGAISTAMLTAGTAAIVNVAANEAINLLNVRSTQKKAWMAMRQKECTFVDSLQSVNGQCDFYGSSSSFGPLDPSDMVFDGITLAAQRNGHEVLRMVCHIDSSRFNELFLHSRFFLVLDSLVFHPFQSYLPNIGVSARDIAHSKNMPDDVVEYWKTISQFDFGELQQPSLHVSIDLFSSWINELVQVFDNVNLGTFSIDIPISQDLLTDSVYVYSRSRALAEGKPLLSVKGSSFVVPRSYMPVAANRPSWGTGEYKMKIVLSETCRYNPNGRRAQNWKKDYNQLVKMQHAGKAQNEYLQHVVTTFRDNGATILKATYTPALNAIFSSSTMGGGSQQGHSGATGGAGGPQGGGASGQPGPPGM